jgi:uncharacterized OB-fold protein
MGFLNRLAKWFEVPDVAFYRCQSCGEQFNSSHSTCPECGEELETGETLKITDYYWGPM